MCVRANGSRRGQRFFSQAGQIRIGQSDARSGNAHRRDGPAQRIHEWRGDAAHARLILFEIQCIAALADRAEVGAHFKGVRSWRVRLSDAEAYNWGSIEILSILLFVVILVRATYRLDLGAGEIFAMIVYVWQFMENLDHVPTLLQQLTRLQDIKKRIEAGASVEDIGAVVEEGEQEEAEAARM